MMTHAITILSDIKSEHWQPKLGAVSQAVAGIDDIAQSIKIILTTVPGTDRHRPDFGCKNFSYLDWPVNIVTPFLVRETTNAILKWEPRVTIENIFIRIHQSNIALQVCWRVTSGVLNTTEISYERTTAS